MYNSLKVSKLPNKIEIPYFEKGEKDGLPVIFLHGVGDSHRSWDIVFKHLPPTIRSIALTQRGHGDASKPTTGYEPADFANDVRLFMAELGLDSATIVGHSLGSFVAQRLAIDNPELVNSLILIGSFATCMDNQGVIKFTSENIYGLKDPIGLEFVRSFQLSTFHRPVDPEHFETAVNESLKVPAFVWQQACESMIANDHSAELGQIAAPTLLIWGNKDLFFDRNEQVRLLDGIGNAELKIFDGDGHAPIWESPEKVAKEVERFASKKADRHVKVSAL